jgi:hypothetical protein
VAEARVRASWQGNSVSEHGQQGIADSSPTLRPSHTNQAHGFGGIKERGYRPSVTAKAKRVRMPGPRARRGRYLTRQDNQKGRDGSGWRSSGRCRLVASQRETDRGGASQPGGAVGLICHVAARSTRTRCRGIGTRPVQNWVCGVATTYGKFKEPFS